MSEFVSDKKRIARNTMYLYIRMLLGMIVTLYTARVILESLGAVDYGLYNVVGGVVLLMTFINGPLHSATVRFLTFELGRQNQEKLTETFAASLNLHILAGLLAIIVGETVGLWFLYNKLIIPEERLAVAFWVYHFSIIMCFIDFTQVPYTASINSHENMSLYAYIGLYEAFSKLLIAYMIAIAPYDRLFFYSLLLLINKIGIQLFCRYYSIKHYQECRFKLFWNKTLYKKLYTYAGWDTFGGVAVVCEGQGINILLNLFFGPLVNAARAIGMQIRGATVSFVNSLLTAVKPQIVKNFAVGKYADMYDLVFSTTKFSYFLMLFLMLPIMFEMDIILQIWLGNNIPEYTSTFAIIILLIELVTIIDKSFNMAFHAIGKVKFGNIVGGTLLILSLPISYLCLWLGLKPYSVFVVLLIINIIETIFDFFLIHFYVTFSIRKVVFTIFLPMFVVTIISIIPPIALSFLLGVSFLRMILNIILIEIVLIISIWWLGISNKERAMIKNLITKKLFRRCK